MQVLDLTQPGVDVRTSRKSPASFPRNAALSGKILRARSATAVSTATASQHVSTISHALVILGLQSVKTLVLGFSLVTNLTKSQGKGFKHLAYWKRSIYAAAAASIACRERSTWCSRKKPSSPPC